MAATFKPVLGVEMKRENWRFMCRQVDYVPRCGQGHSERRFGAAREGIALVRCPKPATKPATTCHKKYPKTP